MKSRVLDAMNAQYLSADNAVESGSWFFTASRRRDVEIEDGKRVELLIFDAEPGMVDGKLGDGDNVIINIMLKKGAELSLVHVVTRDSVSDINIDVCEDAQCSVTEVVLGPSRLNVVSSLVGANARFNLNGLFVLTDNQRGNVTVDVNHAHADATSRTQFKGIASGTAKGSFSGMILVEADAQRTLAEQISRNVVLNDAEIKTEPQLEIYADDVKCSHGATVGQLDGEAILYMRQRGLSLEDAKRLQVEGFVSDVVMHSAIERLSEPLQLLLSEKLKEL